MDRAGMRVMHPVGCLWWRRTAAPKATEIAKAGPALAKNFLSVWCGGFDPEKGKKKLMLKKTKCFGLDGFTCLF